MDDKKIFQPNRVREFSTKDNVNNNSIGIQFSTCN